MQNRAPDLRILRCSEALPLSKKELYGKFHSNKNKRNSFSQHLFIQIPAVLVDETSCCSEDWALEQDGSTGTPLLSGECCLSVEISSRTQNQTDSS